MTNQKPNLEGRLSASVGDLIVLTNPEADKEVAGYLTELVYKSVTLSHENPEKRVNWGPQGRSASSIGRGDRKYMLAGFTDYELLRKANQE